MSDPIDPDRLLRQAKELAGFKARRGKPKSIDHRRAVSAAYYALFHELVARSAERLFPDASGDECLKVRRWYSHAEIKRTCTQILKCAAVKKVQLRAPHDVPEGVWALFSRTVGPGRESAVPPNLVIVSDAFVRLIEARHSADYDHEASFPRATTQAYVLEAEDAIKKVRQLGKNPYGRKFLTMLLLRSQSR